MSIDMLTQNSQYIIFGLLIILVVLFIWNIILSVKIGNIRKTFNKSITGYSKDFNLEDMLCKTVSEVSNFRNELDENVKVCADANNKTNEKFDKKLYELNEKINSENKSLQEMIDIINNNLQICVQKTAVVRYNPFQYVGGELCFALAMLDKRNDGCIINTIFTETGSYTYCKPVENGESSVKLSEEEKQAINLAKNKY